MVGNVLASDQRNKLTIMWSALSSPGSCCPSDLVTLSLTTGTKTNPLTEKNTVVVVNHNLARGPSAVGP